MSELRPSHQGSSGYSVADEIDVILNRTVETYPPRDPANFLEWIRLLRTVRSLLELIELQLIKPDFSSVR